MEAPLNLENEKKKNIRLTIGVAALGVLGFIIFYIAYFILIFCYPSKLFNLMPFPSFTESVVGFKGNLLIFSKTVTFKGPMLENQPEERMVYRVFDGKSLSQPEEAKPFASLCPTEDKIYFFDQGLYRTFDGKNWESFKNPAIGSNPKGAIGPSGIWVLSTHKKKPVLNLISGNEVREIPLPEDELLEKLESVLPSFSASEMSSSSSLRKRIPFSVTDMMKRNGINPRASKMAETIMPSHGKIRYIFFRVLVLQNKEKQHSEYIQRMLGLNRKHFLLEKPPFSLL